MLALDRYLGFHFFTNEAGGNMMMFVNLIWAWGHPEVYILVLPAFALVYLVARPVPGLGIAVPALLPGIFAALAAVVLHPAAAAGLAYAGGTLGTLAGADLANLPKVRRLGAPLVSIGGAGTFDGVFVTGIIAVALAGLL